MCASVLITEQKENQHGALFVKQPPRNDKTHTRKPQELGKAGWDVHHRTWDTRRTVFSWAVHSPQRHGTREGTSSRVSMNNTIGQRRIPSLTRFGSEWWFCRTLGRRRTSSPTHGRYWMFAGQSTLLRVHTPHSSTSTLQVDQSIAERPYVGMIRRRLRRQTHAVLKQSGVAVVLPSSYLSELVAQPHSLNFRLDFCRCMYSHRGRCHSARTIYGRRPGSYDGKGSPGPARMRSPYARVRGPHPNCCVSVSGASRITLEILPPPPRGGGGAQEVSFDKNTPIAGVLTRDNTARLRSKWLSAELCQGTMDLFVCQSRSGKHQQAGRGWGASQAGRPRVLAHLKREMASLS